MNAAKLAPIAIRLPLPPSVNRLWRPVAVYKDGKRSSRMTLTASYKAWRDKAGIALNLAKAANKIKAPLEWYALAVVIPDKARMDIDNAPKAINDLLQAHKVVKNDKRCRCLLLEWSHEIEKEFCEIEILPLTDGTVSVKGWITVG